MSKGQVRYVTPVSHTSSRRVSPKAGGMAKWATSCKQTAVCTNERATARAAAVLVFCVQVSRLHAANCARITVIVNERAASTYLELGEYFGG